MTTGRQLFIYCSAIFLLSWLLQILAIATTGDINSEHARPWLVVTMLVPTFVTIFFLVKNKALRSYLLWKPNSKILQACLVAVIIPTIIAFLILIVVQQLGYGKSGWFSFSTTGVDVSGGPFLLGLGMQNWVKFIFNLLVTGIVYSTITGIVAAGEEFAWRGFFQQTLIERFGLLKGIIILGFIWSMWHLPIQLAGYNFQGNEILGSFILSPIQLIAGSLFFGWLTLSTRSFIPAALAHGAVNSIQEGIIANIQLDVPMIYQHWIRTTVIAFIGLFFFVLLRKK
jgi:uncharacterized protein